jgi:DNA-binding transcriptional MerR regulator
VQAFSSGLDVVRRLRPIAFEWRDGGLKDVGFAAEDVHAIAPLLTTTNQDGQIEGVKYAQLTTVLVNAINEQQTQIDAQKELLAAQRRALQEQQQQNQVQQKQLQKQQGQLEALIKLVCSSQPQAEVCK